MSTTNNQNQINSQTHEGHSLKEMFEIYSNDTGESLYIANSRFDLNQCMNAMKHDGKSVSYAPVTEFKDPAHLASIPRWFEQ